MRPRRHRIAAILTAALLVGAVPMPVGAARPEAAGKKPAPSGPETIDWSGHSWLVKDHSRKIGPGPNFFSGANVEVRGDRLHLRIAASGRKWTTAEVINTASLGYGTYTWQLAPVGPLDPNVVLGLFTWNDAPDYAHREIDIELAKWGNAADPTNAQYVVQPWDAPDHDLRWAFAAQGQSTIHEFTWAPGRVDFESRTVGGTLLHRWSYAGSDVPVAGGETPRMNLWLYRGSAPTDGQPVEVILERFTHTKS